MLEVLEDPTALQLDLVLDSGRRRDEVQLELALESFLDDLEVEEAKEAAPKTKTERGRVLRLERQRAIIELQLLERLLEVSETFGVGWKESRKDHRLDLSV